MSLGIVVKGPEGLVLAAESRVTITVSPTAPTSQAQVIPVYFDNAVKLLSFSEPNTAVGAVTYGQAAIGMRTAYSFIPEFEEELPQGRLSIKDFSAHLSRFNRLLRLYSSCSCLYPYRQWPYKTAWIWLSSSSGRP